MKKKKGGIWGEYRRNISCFHSSGLTCCYAVKQRQDTNGLPLLHHDWGVNLWCFLKYNTEREREEEN